MQQSIWRCHAKDVRFGHETFWDETTLAPLPPLPGTWLCAAVLALLQTLTMAEMGVRTAPLLALL